MKVETNYKLIADNGQYLKRHALIYDRKDGSFVGKFLGFSGKSIGIELPLGSCISGDQVSDFPLEHAEQWTSEPLPTKPPVVCPESLRRFFRAAHKSEDPKQIALAVKALGLWMYDEVLPRPDDEIPF